VLKVDEFDPSILNDDIMDSDSSLVSSDLALVTFISTDKPELLSKVFVPSKLTLQWAISINTFLHSFF
jgi:hypothetical protein